MCHHFIYFLSILNYTPLLPRAVVDQSIAKAFRVWSDVTPLTFSRVFDEEGDIVLAFYRGGKFFNLGLPFDNLCFVWQLLVKSIVDFMGLRSKITSHCLESAGSSAKH